MQAKILNEHATQSAPASANNGVTNGLREELRLVRRGLTVYGRPIGSYARMSNENLIKANAQGLTPAQIAKKFKIGRQTIYSRMKALQIAARQTRPTDTDLLIALEDRLSLKQAGDRLGVSGTNVADRWKKMGIDSVRRNPYGRKVTNEQVLKAHDENLNNTEIAEKLSVSPKTINTRLRALGMEANRTRRYPSNIPDDEFRRLHKQDMTTVAVARELKVTPQTVVFHWKRLGLQPRGRGTKHALEEGFKKLQTWNGSMTTGEKILDLYDNNIPLKEIADAFKVSESTIRMRLRRFGLEVQ